MPTKYRAAIIGATGRGDYGHGLDEAFRDVDSVEVVALADADPQGLEATGAKLGIAQRYADYRQMLEAERPDLVAIAPHSVNERGAMIKAAAGVGAHIYCEKPLVATLAEADAIYAACSAAGVQLAMAHQFGAMPAVRRALVEVRAGTYGRLLCLWARPKDDARGGGEELIVHGTHLFDLMIAFAGPPQWVSGHIGVDGRDATPAAARRHPHLGPMAGDALSATFGFGDGVYGFINSTADLDRDEYMLYGLKLECENALLHICSPGEVYVYPAPTVLPEAGNLSWQPLSADGGPPPGQKWLDWGNQVLVADLVAAAYSEQYASDGLRQAHLITEMIQGVYASHFADGQRLAIPLKERQHPLETV